MTPPSRERRRRRLSVRVGDRSLKLDADWVILSACNTAAGGAGAEGLSGLARAFFYAQARTLLVSHWEVISPTVKLVTGAMSQLVADQTMGRAEAMRQSMLALIDKRTPQEAHPAFWAPFVVVGERVELSHPSIPISANRVRCIPPRGDLYNRGEKQCRALIVPMWIRLDLDRFA